jgi:predicted HAD superfamily phosphohydrolase YqeG
MTKKLLYAIEQAQRTVKKTFLFDFDNTISKYTGWKGADHFEDDEIPAVTAVIRRLKKEGATIVIHTTRGDTPKLRAWLEERKIPFDSIQKKPIGMVYIDDRGLNFHGQNEGQLYTDIQKVLQSAEKRY